MGAVAIGLGISVISGLMQAEAAMQEGQANLEYNEEIARQFEERAGALGDQAHLDTLWHRDNVKRFTATQEAALAAGGVSGSQTALELLSDTARQAALDELAIRRNADLKITEATYQATMARKAGQNAMYAASADANASLLGTAGVVTDSWYKWGQTSQGKQPDPSGTGRRAWR